MVGGGLCLSAPGAPLVAQTVRGTVVEAHTSVPVAGAIVTLVEDGAGDRGATLTDERGGFVLSAPEPGAYRVRVERIGVRTVTTSPAELRAGTTHRRTIPVPVEAIQLEPLRAEFETRCVSRPSTDRHVGRVWGEARKALRAARLARYRPFLFEVEKRQAWVDPRRRRVEDERSIVRWTFHRESPFTARSSEEAASLGWADVTPDSVQYYAPDVDALLSDAFLDGHCFRLVDAEEREGEIGLAIEPVDRDDRVEIEGVLWVELETAELRELEFGYVGLPWRAMEEEAGGRIAFRRLANGAWIVDAWVLKAPLLAPPSRRPGRVEAIKVVGSRMVTVEEPGGGPTRRGT